MRIEVYLSNGDHHGTITTTPGHAPDDYEQDQLEGLLGAAEETERAAGLEVEPPVIITDYAHLASAIINGDLSGLDDEDNRGLEAFYRYVEGYEVVDVRGDSYFGEPDRGGLTGDVVDYVCQLVRESGKVGVGPNARPNPAGIEDLEAGNA